MAKGSGTPSISIKRDSEELATLRGERFIGTHLFTSLADKDSVYYFVDFSNTKKKVEFHDFSISADGQCIITVFTNPILSDNGTPISIANANALSLNKNQLQIYFAPTISDNGQQVMQTYVASGARGDRVMTLVFTYRILNSSMLIQVENVSGTSMAYGSVIFDWKESD